MSNREVSLICIRSAAAAAAAAALCVAILLLLQQQQCCCFLLLFVIMCRMAKFVAGPLNLMPVYSFSSFKRDLLLMYPLAVLCRFYGLDLPTSSVLMDMRGAKAGVSPPRRSPPCIICIMSNNRPMSFYGEHLITRPCLQLRKSTANNHGVYDDLHKMARIFLFFLYCFFAFFSRVFFFNSIFRFFQFPLHVPSFIRFVR